jgi:hypothetical protein
VTDKRTRLALERAMAAMGGDVDAKLYPDLEATAMYRLEPPGSECIVLACTACRTVTVRPGSPRLERLSMACNNCGRLWPLRPPAEVLAFGRTGLQIVTGPH